mmetsp:Transcript_152805/g.388282  ORF Transcript_152805/g.388282 Transcript_152805/m.388282 type:complete len:82 (+) Transcript_152805:2419-2664(+)
MWNTATTVACFDTTAKTDAYTAVPDGHQQELANVLWSHRLSCVRLACCLRLAGSMMHKAACLLHVAVGRKFRGKTNRTTPG